MASLLVKVQHKLSMTAQRKIRNALEGSHGSIFKGRSMDFDDLREYVPSDDIKDVDWKATARTGQMLIRRYVAVRKLQVMLVVDTGKTMAATAPDGNTKKDIAIMTAGAIASVAQKNGDLVGLVAGDAAGQFRMPLKDSRSHIELVLQHINHAIDLQAAASDIKGLLDSIRRGNRKRLLLVVVTDDIRFVSENEQLLRRLAAQHEIVCAIINDADPADSKWSGSQVVDIERDAVLPEYIRNYADLDIAYKQAVLQQWTTGKQVLGRLVIPVVTIDALDQVVNQVIRLLEEKRRVRR